MSLLGHCTKTKNPETRKFTGKLHVSPGTGYYLPLDTSFAIEGHMSTLTGHHQLLSFYIIAISLFVKHKIGKLICALGYMSFCVKSCHFAGESLNRLRRIS